MVVCRVSRDTTMSMACHHHEKGSALLIVLGLVAVIAGWASSAAYEDLLELRRAEHQQSSTKAELACLSVLELVKQGLIQDAKDSTTDDLDEQWAQTAPPFPVDDGLVSGSVVDVNRYLNFNDLINTQGTVDMPMLHTMQRLFTQMQLDPSLLDALVDWMDRDQQVFGYAGAEDNNYYSRDYHVKNALLDRFDELRMVQGFTPKMLPILRKNFIVFPKHGAFTGVNINTVQTSVLQAMFPNMDANTMTDIINNRPYTQLTTLQNAIWAKGGEAPQMFARLRVVSDGFMVHTHAIFDTSDRRETIALYRQGQNISWLWRVRMLWQAPTPEQQAGSNP